MRSLTDLDLHTIVNSVEPGDGREARIVYVIPNPRLNQTNGFESEGAQTYTKYVRKAEPRKIRLDHLKMGLGIIHELDLQRYLSSNQLTIDIH